MGLTKNEKIALKMVREGNGDLSNRGELFAAIAKATKAINDVGVKKTGHYASQYSGNYSYASTADVLGVISDKITEFGLSVIRLWLGVDEEVRTTTQSNGKVKKTFIAKVIGVYAVVHESGQLFYGVGRGWGTGGDDKIVHKASTMAQKYFERNAFNVATNEDDGDANKGEVPPPEKARKKKITRRASVKRPAKPTKKDEPNKPQAQEDKPEAGSAAKLKEIAEPAYPKFWHKWAVKEYPAVFADEKDALAALRNMGKENKKDEKDKAKMWKHWLETIATKKMEKEKEDDTPPQIDPEGQE